MGGGHRRRVGARCLALRLAGLSGLATRSRIGPAYGLHAGRLRRWRVRHVPFPRRKRKHCALACWNMMIPYLCPQLPQKQKEALGYLAKVPLVYTNVALANWRAFASLGVGKVHCPGSYHTSVKLNPVTNIGAYQAPRSP